jgi:plastocyanin
MLVGALVALAGAGAVATATPLDVELQAAAASWDHVVEVGELGGGTPSYSDELTSSPVTVVTSGTTVRWFWTGSLSHSVTSGIASPAGGDGTFDSGVRHASQEPENGGNGQPFMVTFTQPGVYKYFCEVHLAQHGVVVVV